MLKNKNYCEWIIIGICAVVVGWYIKEIVNCFWLPQMDFGEGLMWLTTKLFASGEFNWHIDTIPYTTSFYGFTFYAISTPLIRVFGDGLQVLRSIEIVATFGSLVCVFLILKRHIDWKYALIGAVLPLAVPAFRDWSIQARVDMLAVNLSLIGLLIADRYKDSGKVYITVILLILAFYTKQNFVCVAIAVSAYLMMIDKKKGLIFAGLYGVGIVVVMVVGNLFTDGQFWKHMTIYGGTNPMFWDYNIVVHIIGLVISGMIVSLIVCLIYVRKNKINLFTLLLMVALVVNGLMVMRCGSFVNYFMESVVAVCLVVGLALPEMLKSKMKWVVCGLLIVQVVVLGRNSVIQIPDEDYKARNELVKELIQDTDKPILSVNMSVVIEAGKVPYYEPFVFTHLQNLGLWDKSIVLDDLKNGSIEYVILKAPVESSLNRYMVSEDVKKVITEKYEIVYNDYGDRTYDDWYTFVVYKVK